MIYRIYPVLLFTLCVAWLLLGVATIKWYALSLLWLFVVPVPAVIGGYVIAELVAKAFPRMQYIDKREIGAHGHVHAPLGPMLLVLLIGELVAVLTYIRS